jgi:ubiquinone biosynthesis protein
MVVAEGVGRALNPSVNMWQLAQPLIEAWIADNLGPQAQLRTVVEDGIEAARRLPQLVERVEHTLEAAANGGIKLHPSSLAALHGHRHGALLPWVLCAVLAGALLVLVIA